MLHDNGAVYIHTHTHTCIYRVSCFARGQPSRITACCSARKTQHATSSSHHRETARKGKERREGERERKRGDPPPYQQAFPPHPHLQRLRHRREAIYRATLSRYRRARTYARRTLTTLYIYNGARFALSAPVSLGSLAAQHEPEKRAGACFTAKCARCTHTCSPPPPHDDHVLLLSLFLSIYLYIAHSRARAGASNERVLQDG